MQFKINIKTTDLFPGIETFSKNQVKPLVIRLMWIGFEKTEYFNIIFINGI